MTIQQFNELHVWLGIRPDGKETILVVQSHEGHRFDLLSHDRRYMETMRPLVEELLLKSRATPHPLAQIELREYRPVRLEADLLAALRIARSYVEATAEDIRLSQPALDALVPPRPDHARADDSDALTWVEGHLAQIDAAIAKAEAA
jgi:hypothetical protein